MKKLRNTILGIAVAGLMLLSSCSIILPVGATGNAVGSRVGTAKATVYLHVLAFNQDASIQTAAKNGGISKISTVDLKKTDVLGIIQTYETIITGE